MSKELTEQWKNGTLKTGSYYIRTILGNVKSDYFEGKRFCFWSDYEIVKVLAKVPSYETYFKSEHALRRCKRWINMQCVGGPATDVKKKLLEQIEECLKEFK